MTDITPSGIDQAIDDGTGAEQAALFPIDTPTMAALHDRLAALAADRGGMLDIAYRTIDTPVGPLLLAATETGLVRVAYERQDFDTVLESLAQKISPPASWRPPPTPGPVAVEFDAYFAGRDRRSMCPWTMRCPRGGFGSLCNATCRISSMGTPSPTRRSPSPSETRRRCERSARRARRTRCRWWCPAIGCCVPTGAWAATSADWPRRRPC